MFTADNLKAMCALEDLKLPRITYDQCPAVSIGFLVGVVNKKACADINDIDVTEFRATLRQCQNANLLDKICYENCTEFQMTCSQLDAYSLVIKYLADSKFVDQTSKQLTYALAILDVSLYNDPDYYDDHMENQELFNTRVKITGIDTGSRIDLFKKYLIQDMIYFILAMGLILLVMFLYTFSVVITFATLLNVIFSIGITYFLYHVVFRISYFPFLNLLTGLILIAVSSDDVFVFVDIWNHSKSEHPSYTLFDHVYHTLYHAGMSVLVTSLTTSAAFFANIISNITDIKCFGLFTGIAILVNFILMITWTPAIIVGVEICTNYFCSKVKHLICCDRWTNIKRNLSTIVFGKLLPSVIIKAWHFCLVFLFCIGVGGMIVVFYKPTLKLPTSKEFQLFDKNHPLERYTRELDTKFIFVQEQEEAYDSMVAEIFWGVKATDNGNHLDPESDGHLVMDDNFDMSLPEAQEWILNVCTDLKNASFADKYTMQMKCSMELYRDFMKLPCIFEEQHPCCDQPAFPIPTQLFNMCYPRYILYKSRCIGSVSDVLGSPYFDDQNEVKAYNIRFYTSMGWTTKYEEMKNLYNSMNDFMEKHSKVSPESTENGWMYCNFDLFDLQQSLLSATYSSVGLSLASVFVMVLITSLNVLITFFAIVNIALSIIVTVGILVLEGWELNIFESVTISLAVGLSIDFSIHYGVAYRLSKHRRRIDRASEAYAKLGSAVMMAALTTFISGACMLFCRILSYTQLGMFLMVVMSVSWVFASFFFMSLCGKFGPEGSCAEIPVPCCNTSVDQDVYKTDAQGVTNKSFSSSLSILHP